MDKVTFVYKDKPLLKLRKHDLQAALLEAYQALYEAQGESFQEYLEWRRQREDPVKRAAVAKRDTILGQTGQTT